MSHKKTLLAFVSILALFSSGCSNNQVVVESAHETPLAYDVDIVVYGATPGGISAAAAAAGLTVVKNACIGLPTPRPCWSQVSRSSRSTID